MKKFSLSFRLMAVTLGLVCFLGLASFGIVRYIVTEEKDVVTKTFGSRARGLSDAIGAQFFERYGDVQAFAMNPVIQGKVKSREEIVAALNSYAALYGIYDLILVVSRGGELVAVNDKGPDGKPLKVAQLYERDFSKDPWFKASLEGKATDDPAKAFTGTFVDAVQVDPLVSQVFGEKRLGSAFSAPIRDSSGQVIGVLSNRAGSRWFEVAFQEAYRGLKEDGFERASADLLSSDGKLAYRFAPNLGAAQPGAMPNDFDKLLVLDVAKHLPAAARAMSGKTGGAFETDTSMAEDFAIGYAPVSGPKFVDSLGWSVVVRSPVVEALAFPTRIQNLFYMVFSIVFAFAVLVSIWFARKVSSSLSSIAARTGHGSVQVAKAAGQIAESSQELARASSQQASAVQETAAAVDEITAMVKKSVEAAESARSQVASSRQSVMQGDQVVGDLMTSMRSINESNQSIAQKVDSSQKSMGEIVKLIGEIEQKTKVINDIVFQTKLLSFNASVEAARAGEHGKGFAVVAEEVGNLAHMSGSAAKEISDMLATSVSRVRELADQTSREVESAMQDGRARVEAGLKAAESCGSAFTVIRTAVDEIEGRVTEISEASREQSLGMDEIQKAIAQLDSATVQSSSIAQSSDASAQSLNAEAAGLQASVEELEGLVEGSGKSPKTIATKRVDRSPAAREQEPVRSRSESKAA